MKKLLPIALILFFSFTAFGQVTKKDAPQLDNLLTQRVNLREELAELKKKYSDEHPKVKAINVQIELLNKQIAENENDLEIISQSYSYPFDSEIDGTITVAAIKGDTIKILAKRYKADALEIARFNGLLVNSKLSVGRKIKIPALSMEEYVPLVKTKTNTSASEIEIIGEKPKQSANGAVTAVQKYFNDYLHNPYSLRVVSWGKIKKSYIRTEPYWTVRVKYRARNIFNAYVLADVIYYIRRNKVIGSDSAN